MVELFTCSKCGEVLYIRSADLRDKILTMEVQCLRGHRSIRRLTEHQAHEIAKDIFTKLFACTQCGSAMVLIATEPMDDKTQGLMLCPIHGIQKKDYPSEFAGTVDELALDLFQAQRSLIDSFTCPQCRQTFAITEIQAGSGPFLIMSTRCSNGHRNTRYVSQSVDDELLRKILQKLVHCDRCLMPSELQTTESRGSTTRLTVSCPIHGPLKRDVPTGMVEKIREAIADMPKDAVLKATLLSSQCNRPMSVMRIEPDKNGYRLRCTCPGSGSSVTRTLSIEWDQSVSNRLASAVLSCEYCGLFTELLEAKTKKGMTEFTVVCPIHGVLSRLAPEDVYGHIKEQLPSMDRLSSMVKSLGCGRCGMPLTVRDVEYRAGLVEFDMECRHGHRAKRFFVPDLDSELLAKFYKNLYRCPECYGPLDLVYTQPGSRESKVVLLCPVDGKFVLNVPHDHAEAIRLAYKQIQEDRRKPPQEVVEKPEPLELEPAAPETVTEGQVTALRGCEIVGGKFEYKVKVKNDTQYVITNVTVSIVAYPQDCMELAGETMRTISRIEVGGFRSPQFVFYPTKDCVQGKIVATVSYIDFRDQLHTIQVEPYLIRSVCDLLKPNKKTAEEFDLILGSLTGANQEQVLEWNARVLFTKAEMILPTKNFHIVDKKEKIVGTEFVGTIRGFASGKYTGKNVAVIILITGPEEGRHAVVKVEALGDDVAMLPTTIDELAETMDSWICLRCGAPLDTEQVEELGKHVPISCKYCGHTLTIGLYLQ
ncbi:MAG: hypothetical protein QXS20_03595 [Candidatus Thorarchaeota archaeon]